MFEIVDANELTQAMRSRSTNVAGLAEEMKAIKTYAAVETVLIAGGAPRIGGFQVRPSEADLADAKRQVEMDPNVTPWPLRQATRRIKNALKTVPGIKIGGVKAADGNVSVREGGSKAERAPVLFTAEGTDAMVKWFAATVDADERQKLTNEVSKIAVVEKALATAEAARAAAETPPASEDNKAADKEKAATK